MIDVTEPVEYAIYSNRDSVCPGDPVIITSSINSGIPPYTITDENGDIVTNPEMAYINEQTSFLYTVTDACGSTASDIVTVNVYPVPALSFSADVLNGCQPLTVSFIETSASNSQYLYSWNFGNNSDNNLSFNQNTTHVFENAGIYDVGVSVVTDKGCKNSLLIDNLIEVYKKPDAMFNANPDYVTIIDPTVSFYNMSLWAESYMWSFGDGDSSNIENPYHSYSNIQDYVVSLIAISSNGCIDTVYSKIIVDDIYSLYVPTAFSPDKDGINDKFIVSGYGIDTDDFNMKVYNRWGEIIFESNDIFEGWDGTYGNNGKIVENGTYIWLVTFKTFNGIEYQKRGQVTVIR
jgi:gliding motility-associated-like protein